MGFASTPVKPGIPVLTFPSMPQPTASSVANVPTPFEYVGGDPALDFVNTVDWAREGPRRDRLTHYGRLVTWAEGAGVTDDQTAARLYRMAAEHPARCAEALEQAHAARVVLRDLFRAVVHRHEGMAALGPFNDLLGHAMERLRLRSAPLAYTWSDWGHDPACLVWSVTFSASNLLTSAEASRLGECPGDDCGWMFVDRSRNGLRRWCQMETCGTIAKNRRRRNRREA